MAILFVYTYRPLFTNKFQLHTIMYPAFWCAKYAVKLVSFAVVMFSN